MTCMKTSVLILSMTLVGCASNKNAAPAFKQLPNVVYSAPVGQPATPTSLSVNGSVPEVVDKLQRSLNGQRFAITHVNRAAGIITATFQADPDDYLDCGELKLVSSKGETTTLPAASRSLRYEVPIENNTRIGSVERDLALDGRLVIQVTPAAPGQSIVNIGGDYVLTRTAALKGTSAQTLADEKQYLAFGSGQVVGFGDGGSTVCQSNGELEQQALVQGTPISTPALATVATPSSSTPSSIAKVTPGAPSADVAALWPGGPDAERAALLPPAAAAIANQTRGSALQGSGSAGLQRVRAEFDKLGCAPLTAIEDGENIRVTGFVGSQGSLDQLKTSIRSMDDVGNVSFQVVVTTAPFCELLQVSLPMHQRNSTDAAGASIGVDGSAVALQEGDPVVLRATAPNFESYIYIVYMQEDGKLLNLVPNVNQPDNHRSAGLDFSVGDQPDQPSFSVSPPYGDDLVMLVAASEPLFATPRPLVEYGSSFADELAKRAKDLLTRGGKIVGDLVFLKTSPRSS